RNNSPRIAEIGGIGDHQRLEAVLHERPVIRPVDAGNDAWRDAADGRKRGVRAEWCGSNSSREPLMARSIFRRKPAPGLDPGVDAGSPSKMRPTKNPGDQVACVAEDHAERRHEQRPAPRTVAPPRAAQGAALCPPGFHRQGSTAYFLQLMRAAMLAQRMSRKSGHRFSEIGHAQSKESRAHPAL